MGLILLVVGLATFLFRVPRERPPLSEVNPVLTDLSQDTVETVSLVLLEAGAGEQVVETPVRTDLSLPEHLGGRLEAILAALREETLSDLWPETLSAPTVFTFERDDVGQTAVLDFVVETPPTVSVEGERLLLASLEATLLRNGADAVKILVNHRESDTFLGHIMLP